MGGKTIIVSQTHLRAAPHKLSMSPAAPPQDADGCYHVFIDVGANIGVHARFLLEPEKYVKAKKAQTIFDTELGALAAEPSGTGCDNRDICTFEIEPNPAHAAVHVRNTASYKAMGWCYHYMPFAASNQENATLDFYHQAADTRKNVSEWGFLSSPERKTANVEHVPTLHLSKWLDDHVRNCIIPATPHGGEHTSQVGPKVIMKMDIEGAEWSVLPDLIKSGAL
jgi:Methyltransferase FkbM domain